MYRVLVTDGVDAEGVTLLTSEAQLQVDELPTLPKDELLARIPDYDAIVGRSATRISAELLRAGTRLKVVGRAGVGIDNIALDVATARGIAVINAPAGNTVAVAELFYGAVIGLLRQLPRRLHAGRTTEAVPQQAQRIPQACRAALQQDRAKGACQYHQQTGRLQQGGQVAAVCPLRAEDRADRNDEADQAAPVHACSFSVARRRAMA